MPEKPKKISILQTRAKLQESTIDVEARTVEVLFGTENMMPNHHYSIGDYNEILSLDPMHVRMDRINSGAPVLFMHDRYKQIGVVERASIKNNQGFAVLRFSKNEEADKIWKDVVDGIVKNVSCGYRVYEYLDISAPDSGRTTLKAVDWEPAEISVATVPIDFTTGVRSETNETEHVLKISKLNNDSMTPEEIEAARLAAEAEAAKAPATPPAQPATPPAPTPAADPVDQARASTTAVAFEQTRAAEINKAVMVAGLPISLAIELIENKTPLDQARAKITEEWTKKDPNSKTSNVNVKVTGPDAVDVQRAAKMNGLLLRATPEAAKMLKPEEIAAARIYREDSMFDIARACLQATGVDTQGMGKLELVKRAITSSTSDFPVLMSGMNRQILLNAYNAVVDTWRQFCRVGSVSDFREFRRLRLGTLSNLETVGENGEFKTKKLNDADYEKISITTKGNIINLSRQMIINDDLSGIAQILEAFGRAAKRSIESDVYSQFALNGGTGPLMVDGLPLFHESHGNIAAVAAAPSVLSFDAMRTQMRSIKDKDQNDFLDIMLSIWLGPVALKSGADVINKSQYDVDVSNKFQVPNKSQGMFSKIVDSPRLSGTAWYGLADPSVEPVFEVAFLNGNESPNLESQEGFEVDGMSWRMRHDWGVAPIGYRGIIKNAGV
jgi:hypothetical protein